MIDFIICLGLAVTIFIFIYCQNSGNMMSPVLIFIFTWYIPLSVSLLGLSRWQGEYSQQALWVIFGVTLLITTILVIADLIFVGKIPMETTIAKIRNSAKTIKWDIYPVVFILLLCTIIITLILYWVEFRPMGFPLFSFDRSLIQEFGPKINRMGKESNLQILISADYLVGAVAFLGFFFSRRNRVLYAILALVPVVTGLLKLSKMDMLEPIVTYAILGYYTTWSKKKYPFWKTFRLFIVTILVLSMIFGFLVNLRNQRITGSTSVNYGDLIDFRLRTGYKVLDDAMSFYYGYTSLPFVNFDRALQIQPDYKLGLSFFRPLFTVTLESYQIDKILTTTFTNYLNSAATVGTFMRDLYFEGGILMVFVGALFYAYLIALTYVLARKKASIYTLFLYASFVFPFIWIIFSNDFMNLNVYTGPIGAIALIKLLVVVSNNNSSTVAITRQVGVGPASTKSLLNE